jgi:hypothetical protein
VAVQVLISFVTTSDPWPARKKKLGPASTVTAALALQAPYVHLLYTRGTETNFRKTATFLQHLSWKPQVLGHRLEIPDPADYDRLKDVLPGVLKKIRGQHRGCHFYLVSGLAQARLILALCLVSGVLDGTLLEVSKPDPGRPWGRHAGTYQRRLRPVNLQIFEYFRQLTVELYGRVRLVVNVKDEEAQLEGAVLDLRRRGGRARTFQILVLLVAKKLYGGRERQVATNWLASRVYGRSVEDGGVCVRRAVESLNRQVQKRLGQNLVAGAEGRYEIALAEEEIRIAEGGDALREYLLQQGIVRGGEIREEFPLLG